MSCVMLESCGICSVGSGLLDIVQVHLFLFYFILIIIYGITFEVWCVYLWRGGRVYLWSYVLSEVCSLCV